MYDPTIHHRRSIRLKNYDFSDKGRYFITLCSVDRKCMFGEIKQGKMHLNAFGEIANEEWKNTTKIRKNISLGEFIVMPNHFHAIIHINYRVDSKTKENMGKFISPSQTIGAIIRGFKGATTKTINDFIRNSNKTGELKFALLRDFAPLPDSHLKKINLSGKGSIWQRDYFDIIINSEKAYNNISNYIINNPKNWDSNKIR